MAILLQVPVAVPNNSKSIKGSAHEELGEHK